MSNAAEAPLIASLEERARKRLARIILPEGNDPTILEAACRAAGAGIAQPILIGNEAEIHAEAAGLNLDLSGVEFLDPPDAGAVEALCDEYEKVDFLFPRAYLRQQFAEPLAYAAMLVRLGAADAMVAGIAHTTGDVIIAGKSFIGAAPGISTVSSSFTMDVPGYDGPCGSALVLGDCSVCVSPTAVQLADIAISTAQTARRVLECDPRVALLSFSTKGSADRAETEPIIEAVRLLEERGVDFAFDGDLQLDAAIVPSVAAKKVPGTSPVAGQANVLVFPNLFAGNICYKAIQRFAGGAAYGPLLQGLAKPVCDLSRGATAEDVYGAILITALSA